MELFFLGTGEAFSAKANTSILVDGRILLDCGLTTVQQLFKAEADFSKISVVVLSHFHMDHVFGLPAFLCACRKQDRSKPLTVIGPEKSDEYIKSLLSVAHKSYSDFEFPVKVMDARTVSLDGYDLSFASMKHSIPTKAVSVSVCGKKIVYCGDGKPTEEAFKLMSDADLLIAEAYLGGSGCHSSITEVAEYAKKAGVKNIALVHISGKEDVEGKLRIARKNYPSLLVPADLSKTIV